MNTESKNHWENVYSSKQPNEVSWTQEIPTTSLQFIDSFGIDKSSSIIDIGGGDSKLVDYLLEQGYENISVLDISAQSLERAKNRLGVKAKQVNWIVSDITEFRPTTKYQVWHDRATFHFLTTSEQIHKYLTIANSSVTGYMTIGTFSTNGPEKCSGLPVKQYDEKTLSNELNGGFNKIKCITEVHKTPFNTMQDFLICSFKKR